MRRDFRRPKISSLTSFFYQRTGFDALDDLLAGHGLSYGATILLRGKPGTGKTTLALQIGRNILVDPNSNFSLLFLSLEQHLPSLNRMVQSLGLAEDIDDYLTSGVGPPSDEPRYSVTRPLNQIRRAFEAEALASVRLRMGEDAERLSEPAKKAELLKEYVNLDLRAPLARLWRIWNDDEEGDDENERQRVPAPVFACTGIQATPHFAERGRS